MNKGEFIIHLKQQVIDYLNLLDIETEDLDIKAPLFGPDGDLGLDSIDSVELLVMLEREYQIKITDPKEGRKVLENIEIMANYILEHRQQ
jgi:acyl carrier protein